MSAGGGYREPAFHVADRLSHDDGPWEVIGQYSQRYELYLQGTAVETVRGPVEAEGYGLRLFRPRGSVTGVGFQCSNDFTAEGVRTARDDAEQLGTYGSFPATKVPLPSTRQDGAGDLEILDRALWDRPRQAIEEYGAALRRAFAPERDVVPTFGAIRVVLEEISIANSAGARVRYRATRTELETMVKAHGGAEGRPPGEYWATSHGRRLDPRSVPAEVRAWCRHARAVRVAEPSPTGALPVVLPPEVLASVLPLALSARLSAAARIANTAPEEGSAIASEHLTVYDDGRVPWALDSRPTDDEGTPQHRQRLFDGGRLTSLFYDALHGGAFDRSPTGNARRYGRIGYPNWLVSRSGPAPGTTTVSIAPGEGGSDEELVEGVRDGIWVEEIGFPNPDRVTSAFGGEIRIGYRIRDGKISTAVRGGTVGGRVIAPPGEPSIFASVRAVGGRARLASSVFAPPILVDSMSVAGGAGPG